MSAIVGPVSGYSLVSDPMYLGDVELAKDTLLVLESWEPNKESKYNWVWAINLREFCLHFFHSSDGMRLGRKSAVAHALNSYTGSEVKVEAVPVSDGCLVSLNGLWVGCGVDLELFKGAAAASTRPDGKETD
eukprot:15367042-Ditylum_brightwellii.AAC.2